MSKPSLIKNLTLLKKFVVLTEISYSQFFLALALAVAASLFEGISLTLLIPLIHGMIEGDFSFVTSLPIINQVTGRLPNYFAVGNRNFIIFLLVLTFLSAILKIICNYFSSLTLIFLVRSFVNRLRGHVFSRILTFGKLYFDRKNQGELHQVITNFVGGISSALHNLHSGLYALCTLIVYITLMFSISWQLTLIVLTIFPVLHFSLLSLIKRIGKTSRDFADAYKQLGKKLLNALSSLTLIQAYRNEDQEIKEFKTLSGRVEYAERSLDKKNLLIAPLQEFIGLCFLFLLVGIICFLMSIDRNWNIAGYMVFILVLRRCAVMFGVFNNMRSSLALATGPLEQISALFNDDDKFYVKDGAKRLDKPHTDIEIKELTYAYPDAQTTLHGISLTLPRGKTTALVGESGAGKSTLMNLLMRFYDPPKGSITLNGEDIREFSLDSWRKTISYVPQEAILFHGTLRENIIYGLQTPLLDAELLSILEKARLKELTTNLTQGLDTVVGERGVKLSGGEKQRVAIARAFIKNTPILLLDEATSALDSETETLIQEALSELLTGKTTLVIAHRLSTIKDADKIIVLEKGKVIEEGNLKQLLARQAAFSKYWEKQNFF